MLSFKGNLRTQRHEICSQETRVILSDLTLLESVPGRDRQTDRRTDGQNYDS